METESKRVLSVGIDIGTTTSHLVFSRLTLRVDPFARSRKLRVAEREIVYRSRIYLTPLRRGNAEIDVEALLPLIEAEYRAAGLSHADVDTGAVIITGESSRKDNAQRIIDSIASESGRFVAATTGPNFESVISAHGSGATQVSREKGIRLVHTDVGGGTSNIAVIDDGAVVSTSCLNIGGRLIAYDGDRVITRLEPSGRMLLRHLNLGLEMGDRLSVEDELQICRLMASVLVSDLTGEPSSPLGDALRTVEPLEPEILRGVLHYSFSGGVAEYIYGFEQGEYGDLGRRLGDAVKFLIAEKGLRVVYVPERIRATVIGASGFTLQVSGPTTFASPAFKLPLRNIPVVIPRIDPRGITAKRVKDAVAHALNRFDLSGDPRPVAVAVKGAFPMKYEPLKALGVGLSEALSAWFSGGVPVVLVFDDDIGNSIGNVMKRETVEGNLLSIDEIELLEGDFLDVGEPLEGTPVIYPVVVKSLIFS